MSVLREEHRIPMSVLREEHRIPISVVREGLRTAGAAPDARGPD
jgi:hypothetical protein